MRPDVTTGEITRLLGAWRSGDSSAIERLIPLVYDELRWRAHAQLRHTRADLAFSTTELVHEAYLRLVHPGDPAWESRDHFFAVAAKAISIPTIPYQFPRRAVSCRLNPPRLKINNALAAMYAMVIRLVFI